MTQLQISELKEKFYKECTIDEITTSNDYYIRYGDFKCSTHSVWQFILDNCIQKEEEKWDYKKLDELLGQDPPFSDDQI